MKKSLVALAVLGAFSGLAQAEGSVTLSGIIDVSVMSQSGVTPTAPNNTSTTASVIGFVDGQILPSIYDLKGSEDLGGGLKAGFELQGGFSSGNGAVNSADGVLIGKGIFGREAKLTVGGDWGTIGAGLQVDPALVAAIATEPRGMTDSLSSLGYWIGATAGNGSGGYVLTGGIFDQNSVSYSYSGNGLYLGLLYGIGGVAGSTTAGSVTSIGGSYTNSGFTISAGYAQDKADVAATAAVAATATTKAVPATTGYTGTNSQETVVGVGYAVGAFAVRLQYGEFKSGYGNNSNASTYGQAADDVKEVGIGFDWKDGANTVNLSYYNAKDDGPGLGGKTTDFAILDTYGLSKRTSIYGQIGYVKADQTGAGASEQIAAFYTAGGPPVPGNSSTVVGVGVQHTF